MVIGKSNCNLHWSGKISPATLWFFICGRSLEAKNFIKLIKGTLQFWDFTVEFKNILNVTRISPKTWIIYVKPIHLKNVILNPRFMTTVGLTCDVLSDTGTAAKNTLVQFYTEKSFKTATVRRLCIILFPSPSSPTRQIRQKRLNDEHKTMELVEVSLVSTDKGIQI